MEDYWPMTPTGLVLMRLVYSREVLCIACISGVVLILIHLRHADLLVLNSTSKDKRNARLYGSTNKT